MAVQVSIYEAEPKEVEFREGMTLAEALEAAGYTPDRDVTVSLNRRTRRNMSDRLHDGDRVMVTPNIKNG